VSLYLSVRPDLEVPQYFDFVVLCYWVGLVEPDVICRFDLVVLAYAVVDFRCYVVMSCTGFLLSWGTH